MMLCQQEKKPTSLQVDLFSSESGSFLKPSASILYERMSVKTNTNLALIWHTQTCLAF